LEQLKQSFNMNLPASAVAEVKPTVDPSLSEK